VTVDGFDLYSTECCRRAISKLTLLPQYRGQPVTIRSARGLARPGTRSAGAVCRAANRQGVPVFARRASASGMRRFQFASKLSESSGIEAWASKEL